MFHTAVPSCSTSCGRVYAALVGDGRGDVQLSLASVTLGKELVLLASQSVSRRRPVRSHPARHRHTHTDTHTSSDTHKL